MDVSFSKVFSDVAPADMYKFLVLKNNMLSAVVCKYYDRKRLQSLASSLNLESGDHVFKAMPYFVAKEDLFPNTYHGFCHIQTIPVLPLVPV